MKKLFYRLASSRSFAKLFSLLACVALGSVFAQQAVAQDFDFGWEPFPPSSWDGGWDPTLHCEALSGGATTLTRNLIPGTDSVVQDGLVKCTFTDPNNTTCGSPNCTSAGFKATATCSLHIQTNNLSEKCDNGATTSTLTVTGTCPVATIPQGQGTIACTGAPFCSYAGSNPTGNTSGQCVWNVGFGALRGQKVVPLTTSQCQTAFGSPPVVFSFSEILEGRDCQVTSQIADIGGITQDYCHSDTWDPSQAAFCDFPQQSVKNTATGVVKNFLTADTEYTPNTINSDCSGNKDKGSVTLTVLGNNIDPNTNPIAVQAINTASITVNGFPASSCSFPNPDTLQCRVPSCIGTHSIIEHTIVPGTNTATLTMEACIGAQNSNGTCADTQVVGDVETRKIN